MLKREARPEASRFWSYGAPLLALLITVVIGVLLFQDLTVVPLLILIPALAGAPAEMAPVLTPPPPPARLTLPAVIVLAGRPDWARPSVACSTSLMA